MSRLRLKEETLPEELKWLLTLIKKLHTTSTYHINKEHKDVFGTNLDSVVLNKRIHLLKSAGFIKSVERGVYEPITKIEG